MQDGVGSAVDAVQDGVGSAVDAVQDGVGAAADLVAGDPDPQGPGQDVAPILLDMEKDPGQSSGLSLYTGPQGYLRVHEVSESSPFAGLIEPHDELVSINGIEIRDAEEAGPAIVAAEELVIWGRFKNAEAIAAKTDSKAQQLTLELAKDAAVESGVVLYTGPTGKLRVKSVEASSPFAGLLEAMDELLELNGARTTEPMATSDALTAATSVSLVGRFQLAAAVAAKTAETRGEPAPASVHKGAVRSIRAPGHAAQAGTRITRGAAARSSAEGAAAAEPTPAAAAPPPPKVKLPKAGVKLIEVKMEPVPPQPETPFQQFREAHRRYMEAFNALGKAATG